ncbi:Pkinase-domain-containing protein [Thelephora terrestris]|uniref:Pkinase-domain-containing protein n=1 Tax=Thelephora terrestris TaxID=56493 RepID=A0A9P6HL58_9AGAM|nr:Pkinase-domain-containing protein [Thelephora terrestris]
MSAGHCHSASLSQNHKAQLANAYNELGKELASQKIRVVGNYTLGKVIGEGTYGVVRLGTHRLTGTRVAVKQIPKAMSSTLTREIHHHRQLHHPHVIQLYEVIATENHIWLVTELCSGGELFDYLVEKGRVSEAETRIIFGQLCLSVAYIHGKGILHRDLKLENVLLDERCRVKLGDFGFTREFERGSLLETFCGTTGYASPEMLQGKKYIGPEVDVWSLGIILYTLLTGGLPFDDDDDVVMRRKIIKGEYDDPEWLSDEVRDLIRKVLNQDSLQRLSISQILAHPWFTAHRPASPTAFQKTQPTDAAAEHLQDTSSNASDVSNTSAASEYFPSLASTITTPEHGSEEDGPLSDHGAHTIRRNASDVTIRKITEANGKSKVPQTETVVEEQPPALTLKVPCTPQQVSRSNSSSKDPPAYPIRTPVRTKRRSVSSALSDHEDSVINTPEPPVAQQNNFSTLLESPAPMIFSTPVEQRLLNSLSSLGLDTGQIVHSVLSDACDSSGSLWWMLIKKAEAAELDQGHNPVSENKSKRASSKKRIDKPRTHDPKQRPNELDAVSAMTRSAPELAFIPATPTAPNSATQTTPPQPTNPQPALSPSSSVDLTKSFPSTPGSSHRDANKTRKTRAGSVSILQRATTALEATGLVRKKSAEAVREEREKEKHKESERKQASGEETRSSQGSIPSKRPKSPPAKLEGQVAAEYDLDPSHLSSPWIMARPPKASSLESPSPTEATSPGDTLTALPNLGGVNSKGGNVGRNRASLLTAFRMWFDEGRRAKRKEARRNVGLPAAPGTPTNGRARGTMKRRGSGGSKRNTGHRAKHSVSSRRSSSVNSRRSSINSTAMLEGGYQDHVVAMTRQKSDPSRRSYGTHTPSSERGEYSRPSSVMSVTGRRHRKSPSQSSSGSMRTRTMSPTTTKYHRRESSGSSTRVVKQMQTPHRPRATGLHVRSDSATSSVHSLESSRRNSLYDPSESDGPCNISPYRTHRNSFDETTPRRSTATKFIAQKRQVPFMSPLTGSVGRSGWKKAWGVEPPGWQMRAMRPTTIEVLAISPVQENPTNIRDVFSGRPSLSVGHDDESDWVDEDEGTSYYVGGLGQLPSTTAATDRQNSTSQPPSPSPTGGFFNEPLTFSNASKFNNRAPKNRKVSPQWLGSGNTSARGKGQASGAGQPPQPIDAFGETIDGRTSRRQLPGGRSTAPVIQEEDEDEEEE